MKEPTKGATGAARVIVDCEDHLESVPDLAWIIDRLAVGPAVDEAVAQVLARIDELIDKEEEEDSQYHDGYEDTGIEHPHAVRILERLRDDIKDDE